jgi:prophage regulatory protein
MRSVKLPFTRSNDYPRTSNMNVNTASPYLMDEPPTSTGRVLLASAFSHWCILHHGYSPAETAAALDPETAAALDPDFNCGLQDRRTVGTEARLLGGLLAAGHIRAFTRPIGAGNPAPLPSTVWERDDFRPIFACSALDPARPFEDSLRPTHWIFLDLDDFNHVIAASCGEVVPPARQVPDVVAAAPAEPEPEGARHIGNDLVRIKEVERRTQMSRATIYRRIDDGRFPKQVPIAGNIAVWRESDIAEWLANPR